MQYHFSRCNRTEPWTSAKRIPEPKSPDEGAQPVPKHEGLKARHYSAMLSGIRSRLGVQTGKGAPIGRFSCRRTVRVSGEPSWAADEKSSLARIMAHCTALAHLTGGDVPAASRDGKPNKRCYGRKPGGEFGQLRIGIGDYGSVQGQHLNR